MVTHLVQGEQRLLGDETPRDGVGRVEEGGRLVRDRVRVKVRGRARVRVRARR